MEQSKFEQEILSLTQPMYRVCSSLLKREADRQDAVQECILRAWEKKGQLRDESKFRPWLMRILVNCCHSALRKVQREVLVDSAPEKASPADEKMNLRLALDALPEKYNLVLVLHYLSGMEVKEIAFALHLTEGTVKSRLARGRERLRAILKEDLE